MQNKEIKPTKRGRKPGLALPPNNPFANLVRTFQKECSPPIINNKQLADKADLHESTITRMLNGERRSRGNVLALIKGLLDAGSRISLQNANALLAAARHDELNPSDKQEELLLQRLKNKPSYSESELGWRDAPAVDDFQGRKEEIQLLMKWLVEDHCRLVFLLGEGGKGKSYLASKVKKEVDAHFKKRVWHSLENAPYLNKALIECIHKISNGSNPGDIEKNDTYTNMTILIENLYKYRCLLILDNAETIFDKHALAGTYKAGYEDYAQLFNRLGRAGFNSAVIITSRQKPSELVAMESSKGSVRSLFLADLSLEDCEQIIIDKLGLTAAYFSKYKDRWQTIIENCSYNPQILRMFVGTLAESAGASFFEPPENPPIVIGEVKKYLNEAFTKLSNLEILIMLWLAVERKPITLDELRNNLIEPGLYPSQKFDEILRSLLRRSFIYKVESKAFTQQQVVMEFVTDYIIDNVCEEIISGKINWLNLIPVLKTQTEDYVRQYQIQVLVLPIFEQLLKLYKHPSKIKKRVENLLEKLREEYSDEQSYVAGTLLNLLLQNSVSVDYLDFSDLFVNQGYLRALSARHVNFTGTTFNNTVFSDTFGRVLSLAFSPDGRYLAASLAYNGLYVWEFKNADYKTSELVLSTKDNAGWMLSLAFNESSNLLVTGNEEGQTTVWEIPSGKIYDQRKSSNGELWSASFHPTQKVVATGSDNGIVEIWNLTTGEIINIDHCKDGLIRSVVFSPDGNMLASCGKDNCVKLWELKTGRPIKTLSGHTDWVRALAFSKDGRYIVSAGNDNRIIMWGVESGEPLQEFPAFPSGGVISLAFDSAVQLLAAAGESNIIKLFSLEGSETYVNLKGHTGWVNSVVFSPEGSFLASGSDDQSIIIWDNQSGKAVSTIRGFSTYIRAVCFNPNDDNLLAAGDGNNVCIWDINAGEVVREFKNHTSWVRDLAFSSDASFLVSVSEDGTAQVFNFATDTNLTIEGNSGKLVAVSLSSDNTQIALGGENRVIPIINAQTGIPVKTIEGFHDWVISVAFSKNGDFFAAVKHNNNLCAVWNTSNWQIVNTLSDPKNPTLRGVVAIHPTRSVVAVACDDSSIRLWNFETDEVKVIENAHPGWIRTICFHPSGDLLFSAELGTEIKVWDVTSATLVSTLSDTHDDDIWYIAVNSSGTLLASSSRDGSIKIWDTQTLEHVKTLRKARLYEGTNIKDTKGLSDVQKAKLKLLGAID
jgi:WD40 repeat protein